MDNWFELPEPRRALHNGEEGLNGHHYKQGEYMPFYVPRTEMPQIESQDYLALAHFAQHHGVLMTEGIVEAKSLIPHQRIDCGALHKAISGETPKQIEVFARKPVLVSKDNYILDGNHRWWVHVWNKSNVPIWRVNLDFQEAIAFLFSFPRTSMSMVVK